MMNPNMYSQTDSHWRKLPYPSGKYTVGGSGCGLCAVTHILIEQDRYKNATPKTFHPYMRQYATKGHGTKHIGIKNALLHYGHKSVEVIECISNKDKVYAEFRKGNRMAVALFSKGQGPDGTVWTKSGHYIALLDFRVRNGKHEFYVKDSGGRHRRSWYCVEKSMGKRLKKVWIVERLDKPTPPKPYKPEKISVDGDWGKGTTKLTQSVMGTSIDGIILSQPVKYKPYVKGANTKSWQFVTNSSAKGSATVKAIQKMVGANQDGKWGQATSKAVQKWLNKQGYKLSVDGDFGKGSVKAWQKWLNTKVK